MQTSEVLKGAARAIRERGWCQGNLHTGGRTTGRVCAIGALIAAAHQGDADALPFHPVVEAAARALRGGIDQVEEWNDRGTRKVRHVLRALERAAVIEEAKEAAAQQPQPALVAVGAL